MTVLLMTALAAPASSDLPAAEGRPLPLAQRGAPAVAAVQPAELAPAPVRADMADAEAADGALTLLLAGLGAVALVGSRLRRPE